MANKDQFTAKQFIEAIQGSGGIISTISRRVGCTWHTAKKYIDEYATVNQAYQDECEAMLDLAESSALKLIKGEDGPMIRYYLSTKAKHRGYVERQELAGMDGKEIVFKVVRE